MATDNIDREMIDQLTAESTPAVPAQAQPPQVPAAATPAPAPLATESEREKALIEAAKALLIKDTDEASAIAALKTFQKHAGLSDEQTRWLFERANNTQEIDVPDNNDGGPDIRALVAAELERMGVQPQNLNKRIDDEAEARLADTREWLAESLDQGVSKALTEGQPADFLGRIRELDGAEKAANSEQFWKSAIMNKTKAILRSKLNASPDGRFQRKWVSEAISQATQDVSEQLSGMVGAPGRIGRSNADYSAFEQLLKRDEPKLDMAKATSRGDADAELKKFLREQATHMIAQSQGSGVRI